MAAVSYNITKEDNSMPDKSDGEKLETVAFNISKENINWLKKINEKMDRKSVSNTLNFMLNNLRERKNIGMKYDD